MALLSKGDNYAYEIASRLAEDIGMGEGTIYPLMRRMQKDGLVGAYLVESPSGPSRKYYKITPAGRSALESTGERVTMASLPVPEGAAPCAHLPSCSSPSASRPPSRLRG